MAYRRLLPNMAGGSAVQPSNKENEPSATSILCQVQCAFFGPFEFIKDFVTTSGPNRSKWMSLDSGMVQQI